MSTSFSANNALNNGSAYMSGTGCRMHARNLYYTSGSRLHLVQADGQYSAGCNVFIGMVSLG